MNRPKPDYNIENCKKCAFKDHPYVPDKIIGNKILFIAESPSIVEIQKGEPLVGKAGKIFQDTLAFVGIPKEDISIGNTCHCYCPRKKDGSLGKPSSKEIKLCKPIIEHTIKQVKPEWIVTLGEISTCVLLGVRSVNMTNISGTVQNSEYGRFIPLLHPSYLNYRPYETQKYRISFQRLKEYVYNTEVKIPNIYKIDNNNPEARKWFFDNLNGNPITVDVETTGLELFTEKVDLLSLCLGTQDQNCIVVDWALTQDNKYKEILENSNIPKIGHNCLHGNTIILMANGEKQKISYLFNNKVTDSVLTFNPATQKIESKRITNWFKIIDNNIKWKKVITKNSINGTQSHRLTPDHKIYIKNKGMVRVDEANTEDLLLIYRPNLSNIQKQIVLGSGLGDGCLYIKKKSKSKNPSLVIAHCKEQKDYVIWKHDILYNISNKIKKEINNRGFSKKGGVLYRFRVKALPDLLPIYNLLNKQNNIKKVITNEYLNQMTALGFAVWFMDDGSLNKGKTSEHIKIHANRFSEESIDIVIQFFKDKYNIHFSKHRRRHDMYDLAIGKRYGGYEFIQMIAPYIQPCLAYKIPSFYKGNIGELVQPTINDNTYINYTYSEILKIVDAPAQNMQNIRYCIEVIDNHNFFTTMGLVSNCKFDISALKKCANINVRGRLHDTMLAHYLDTGQVGGAIISNNLKNVAKSYGIPIGQIKEVDNTKMGELPKEELYEYNKSDVVLTTYLHQRIPKREPAYTLLCEAIPMLADVEARGLLIDSKYLQDILLPKYEKLCEDSLEDVCDFVGNKDFNPNSPKQVREYLIKQKIKLPKTEAGNPSASAEVLKTITHPSCKKILTHRGYAKLLSTYIRPYLGKDRLYSHYNLTFTETGRISSDSPNVQNIPRDPEFRKLFIAPEGYYFVSFDYSQLEPKILAFLAQDFDLLQSRDIYTDMFKHPSMYNRLPTKEERQIFKTRTLGMIYGKDDPDFMIIFYKAFPKVAKWIANAKAKALNTRRIDIPYTNRWRDLSKETDFGKIKRLGINTPISSPASDITVNACTQVYKAGFEDVHMCNEVHDEGDYYIRKDLVEKGILNDIKQIMEESVTQIIPEMKDILKVDCEYGNSWAFS